MTEMIWPTEPIADEFEQVRKSQEVALDAETCTLSISMLWAEVGSTATPAEALQRRLAAGRTVAAIIQGQVVEIIPQPETVGDFYHRPHQEGIEHGPYAPLPGADLKEQSLHQLHQHSHALGSAWFKRQISEESAAIINKAIDDSIKEVSQVIW